MSKLDDAKKILQQLGVPSKQTADICCYTLLSLCGITEDLSWDKSCNEWIRIHDIIEFIKNNYNVFYAENSRETFRKQALHEFRNAAFIEDNGKSTNSPHYRYRLTYEMLNLLKSYESNLFKENIDAFLMNHSSLKEIYASKKKMLMQSVTVNNDVLLFSSGKHNKLQKDILEQFAPRFAPNSICLYVGDTINKDLVNDTAKLNELEFAISVHNKMPDIILYREDKNWIYFIEAVASVGPVSPKRILEIQEMTKNVKAGCIYVTAFPDFKEFKKFAADLAWDTEVWISEFPDHMIHLNGDRFMGPRN